MSMHPIADKAEVSVDFPDKAYMGSFSRHSQFDAYADTDSVAIRLVRPGEDRREATVHLHYGLLAGILAELARRSPCAIRSTNRTAWSSAKRQNSSPPHSSRERRAEGPACTDEPKPSWSDLIYHYRAEKTVARID